MTLLAILSTLRSPVVGGKMMGKGIGLDVSSWIEEKINFGKLAF